MVNRCVEVSWATTIVIPVWPFSSFRNLLLNDSEPLVLDSIVLVLPDRRLLRDLLEDVLEPIALLGRLNGIRVGVLPRRVVLLLRNLPLKLVTVVLSLLLSKRTLLLPAPFKLLKLPKLLPLLDTIVCFLRRERC